MSEKVKVKLLKKHYVGDRIIEAGSIVSIDEKKIGKHMKRLDGKKTEGAVERPEPTTLTGDELDNAIQNALGQLDHTNDDHFIQSGKPAVEAVSELVGQDVTRKQIEAVAPDFERETIEA